MRPVQCVHLFVGPLIPDGWTLRNFMRGQKGADKVNDPVLVRWISVARVSASIPIARGIEEYNHNRPHRGVKNRTSHEAFLALEAVLKNEALTV